MGPVMTILNRDVEIERAFKKWASLPKNVRVAYDIETALLGAHIEVGRHRTDGWVTAYGRFIFGPPQTINININIQGCSEYYACVMPPWGT